MSDWFTANAPTADPATGGGDWFSKNAPGAKPADKPEAAQPEGFWHSLVQQLPLAALTQIGHAVFEGTKGNPAPGNQILEGMYQHSKERLQRAKDVLPTADDFRQGNVPAIASGLGASALNAVGAIPIIGGAVDSGEKAGEQIDAGNYRGAAGTLTGSIGSQLAPEAAIRGVKAWRQNVNLGGVLPRTANPVDQAAVQYADANNLPVTAATRTGSKFVGGVQALADHSPIGAAVASRAAVNDARAFTEHAHGLEDQIHPTPVDPVQAGEDVRSHFTDELIPSLHDEATRNYNVLRELEADPVNTQSVQVGTKKVPALNADGREIPGQTVDEPVMEDVALPVDMRRAQAALRPIYQEMKRTMPITQQRSSPGFTALENIMNSKPFVAASTVDTDLGTIKGISREADLPQLRSLGQGLAAKAVGTLEDAVQEAVGKARRSNGGARAYEGNGRTGATDEDAPPPGTHFTTPGEDPNAQSPTAPASTTSPADPGTTGESAPLPQAAGATTPDPGQTDISVPGEARRYKASYKLRELDDVIASHNGQTFQPNPEYGELGDLQNDRQYQDPVNQGKIVSGATDANFDERLHITDNPDATNGPLVTDSARRVLAGNGRKAMLDRVYAAGGKAAQRYRDLLTQKAAQFGIDPAEVAAMKKPVLTREIDDAEFAAPGAKQAAITDFNKTGTAALTPNERAIADSRRVSTDTLDHVGSLLEAKGPDATLADALEGHNGVQVLNHLIDDGVITPQERAAFATTDQLTPAGKQRISSLLTARFFRDPAQMGSVPSSTLAKIQRMAAPLARTDGMGEWDLTPHVRDAVDLLEEARAHGEPDIDTHLQQSGLFGDQAYSPQAVAMAKKIQGSSALELAKNTRQYAADAAFADQGPSLLGETPTPAHSFVDAFGGDREKIVANPNPAPRRVRLANQTPANGPAATPAPRPALGQPAGQEALAALRAGRAATVAKYEAADVLKGIPEEGRQAFDKAFWSRDAGIGQLRKVAEMAPEQMPKLARAYLQEAIDRMTRTGSVNKAGRVDNAWAEVGPETKQLLYKNPALIKSIDNLFTLMRHSIENPNPSGTAMVSSVAGHVGLAIKQPHIGIPIILGAGAVSKLARNPAFMRALQDGFTIPLRDPARASFAAARILKLAGLPQQSAPPDALPAR